MQLPRPQNAHDLESLVTGCDARVRRALDDPRISTALRPTLLAYWNTVRGSDQQRQREHAGLSTIAAIFLLVALSEGVTSFDETLLEAAAGCELYVLSVSMFDAIQDDELEPPLSQLGAARVSNAALIVFVLACDRIMQLGDRVDPDARARLRELVLDRSLLSGRGQDRDLARALPDSVEAAATQAQDKTAAIPMTAELAAMAVGCDADRIALYRRLGRQSALVRQAGNDLRDLFGKRSSDDLESGTWSLPLVAFWRGASAAQRREFTALREALPGSVAALRQLLFTSGAVSTTARVMERARLDIHATLGALEREDAPVALLGALADTATARLYSRTKGTKR